jgi:uncharacterized membrane-anchored protein
VYEIWQEAFFLKSMAFPIPAQYIGSYEANSFREACLKAERDGKLGEDLFNVETLKLWFLGLYQTKEEAEAVIDVVYQMKGYVKDENDKWIKKEKLKKMAKHKKGK